MFSELLSGNTKEKAPSASLEHRHATCLKYPGLTQRSTYLRRLDRLFCRKEIRAWSLQQYEQQPSIFTMHTTGLVQSGPWLCRFCEQPKRNRTRSYQAHKQN